MTSRAERRRAAWEEQPGFKLRARFDDLASDWPGVQRRNVFGSPAYTVPGHLFAVFGDGEIVVKVPEPLREELLRRDEVYEWVPPGSGLRSFGRWIGVPISGFSHEALCRIVEQAYAHAAALAGDVLPLSDPPDDFDGR